LPFFRLLLLNKLLEDGNTLHRNGRLQESAHRYEYALKRLPKKSGLEFEQAQKLFSQLEAHLLLNLSRNHRKRGNYTQAIEKAERVLALSGDHYRQPDHHHHRDDDDHRDGNVSEAFLARARAEFEAGLVEKSNSEAENWFSRALIDLRESMRTRESLLGDDEANLQHHHRLAAQIREAASAAAASKNSSV
jgi:tetratricopeptide (TPR) repeat protein